jgi:hypothetical protein
MEVLAELRYLLRVLLVTVFQVQPQVEAEVDHVLLKLMEVSLEELEELDE